VILVFLLQIGSALAASSISQYGMTWTFDSDYETGQYANGDYWVVGPVAITGISPSGSGNGWEVNPVVTGGQGFGSGCYGGNYDASLTPSLPYTANPGDSIVKVIASGNDRPCVRTASVLTVVDSVPPGNGADVFRPPYVGTDKPMYLVADLRTELLPSVAPVSSIKSLQWTEDRYAKVQLDHKGGGIGRALHPSDHMPDYGGDIGRDNADGALALMLDDPVSEKMQALINYVQYGIDIHYMVRIGQVWPGGGGHRPGQLLPLAFAAVMLDDQEMKDDIEQIRLGGWLHEQRVMWWGENADRALYGYPQGTGDGNDYWNRLETHSSGGKSMKDIYGFIDGGWDPGQSYQGCCTSQPWKGTAIAFHIMPELKDVWYDETFFDYTDRWVNFGVWTEPDPCAPVSQGGGHDYDSGFCIIDPDIAYFNSVDDFACNAGSQCGRFPERHGTGADSGGRRSTFQDNMWDAYRGPSCYDGVCELGEACEFDCGEVESCTSQGYICCSGECTSPRLGIGCGSEVCCTSADCILPTNCGDGTCDTDETCETCEADCGECVCIPIHDADSNPCDGEISTAELNYYIDQWKLGNVDMARLMQAIYLWKV